MDHLIKACSNIDQLHIGYVEPLGKAETVHFFNSFRFKNLTWLSICGRMFDGSYLPLVRTIIYIFPPFFIINIKNYFVSI